MKTAGLLFSLDLMRTLYNGFSNMNQEREEESERLEVIKKTHHMPHWKPYVGIIFIVGALLLLNKKNHPRTDSNT